MKKEMQAIAKTAAGPGNLALRTYKVPSIKSDEVLIRIHAAGICGTDLHIKHDTFPNVPPVILGHEFSGKLVELGPEVIGWSVGDRIVAQPHKGGCGSCRYCNTGQVEICRNKRAIGYKIDGAMAEYVALPFGSLHRIPDDLSFETAALAEPLAVCVKAVAERATVQAGDCVVVLGCGAIGLLAAAVAKAMGAGKVIVVGTDQDLGHRLPIAKAMGIDEAISVQGTDVVKFVMDLKEGGADLVVEASGAPAAINQAFSLLRRDGRICAIGLTADKTVSVPWSAAIHDQINIVSSYSSSWTSWEAAIDLLSSGKVDVEPMISGRYRLNEFEEAFASLERLEAVKNLFQP
ncbi:MAG: alcohol dehydrogenase catalytic domain-containing protein [Verrucomicrobia bacterium]|nr:alcohol dehydrogenase catalytic domain-containing protein [Verrucomicrobiota bacterium]MBT6097830.1 alcohol dehydrogenase catalytic domain-containing protein [Marinovum sp.]MBT6526801.1 alcohol dehydrogenase catalytic domain-containing protein [Marinovum sp.]